VAPGLRIRAPRGATAGWAVAAAILVLDQLSKWWIVAAVMRPPRVIEIMPFLNLAMVWNRGVTFGLLGTGGEAMRWALVALSLAIVAVLAVWLARTAQAGLAAALGAVIGGALGNVMDRLIHGAVADFLDFHAFGWHWPAFNLADAAIVCGIGWLILGAFFAERK